MGLFKKRKNNTENCCCAGSCDAQTIEQAKAAQSEGSAIKVLGGGCAKCHELESNVVQALKELGLNTEVELITDFARIAAYGVMTTPALVVNGNVASYGKVLKTEEIINILRESLL